MEGGRGRGDSVGTEMSEMGGGGRPQKQDREMKAGVRDVSGLPYYPAAESATGDRIRGPVERLHLLLEDPRESKIGTALTFILMMVIFLSTILFCLETLPSTMEYPSNDCKTKCEPIRDVVLPDGSMQPTNRSSYEEFCRDCEPGPAQIFVDLERIICYIFTIEYSVRVLTCWVIPSWLERKRQRGKGLVREASLTDMSPSMERRNSASKMAAGAAKASVKAVTAVAEFGFNQVDSLWNSPYILYPKRIFLFVTTDLMNVIDLMAILPCYFDLNVSLTFLRLLRLFRVLRIIRLSKLSAALMHFSEGMLTFVEVFRKSTLALLILVIYTFFFMVLMAAIVYTFERGDWNPATGRFEREQLYYLDAKGDSPFESIPATFWWTLVTFTTVGYGDMSPTTVWGRVFGVIAMYGGILFIAMPITIIGTQFQEMYDAQEKKYKKVHQEWLSAGRVLITALFSTELEPIRNAWDKWFKFAKSENEKENDVRAIVREEQAKLAEDIHVQLAKLKAMVEELAR